MFNLFGNVKNLPKLERFQSATKEGIRQNITIELEEFCQTCNTTQALNLHISTNAAFLQ